MKFRKINLPNRNGGSSPPAFYSILRDVIPDGKVITYLYDSTGTVLQWVDLPGNNAASTLKESYGYYSGGHQLHYATSPRYNLSASDGNVTYFTYDGSNRLIKAYDWGLMNFAPADGMGTYLQTPAPAPSSPLQTWRTVNFSGYGTGTTAMTDKDGHATNWTVDNLFRVTKIQESNGSSYLTTTQQWDVNNNLTSTIDPRGNVGSTPDPTYETDYAYDANGNTVAVALPAITVSGTTFRPTSLYSYDSSNNNITAYCDPIQTHSLTKDWTGSGPGSSDTLCPSQSGSVRYTWNTADSNEPFGYLTDSYTAAYGSGSPDDSGYHVHFKYDSTGATAGYGVPVTVTGDAITQSIDTSTPTRTPAQTFGYDTLGRLSSYDKGEGAWQLQYDALNRVTSTTDPDGYVSYISYYDNGQVSKTETPYQHARGVGPTFSYDADGDETQETAYHGGTYATPGPSPSPSPTPGLGTPATTKKYYDGADRLVEVQQDRDTSGTGEAYTNPWITRYLYDLSQNGTQSPLPSIGGTAISAHGNLYKTVELVPSTDTVTFSSTTPQANGQFRDVKGNAYDALDRPTVRYFYVVNSNNTADALQQETYSYDSSNPIASGNSDTGLLSSDCNGLSQCTYYAYDNDSKLAQTQHTASSSLDRTFGYDADGRETSVSLPNWGTQYYKYDTDGRMWQSIEPSSIDSYATLTYHYYADGMRSSLDVSSSDLTQTGLFAYAYRTDNKLETQQINQPSNTLVGTTTLNFTYSAAGRLKQRAESGTGANSTPVQYQYDLSYGYMTEMDFPGGNKESNLQYDPSGAPLGEISNWWTTNPSTYQLTIRGEVRTTTGPLGASQPPPSINIMANGVAVNTAYQVSKTLYTTGWSATMDPRMGVVLSSTASDTGSDTNSQNVTFDTIGRVITDYSDYVPGPTCDTCTEKTNQTTRAYDQANQILTTNLQYCAGGCAPTTYSTAAYDWGVNGHPFRIGVSYKGSTTNYETLHWDGNQLLFTTRPGLLDDIKIGEIGDITPQDSAYKGLTFWDRDVAHNVVYCHNATGAAGNGTPAYPYSSGYRNLSIEYTHNPCALYTGETMTIPSSMFWGSVAYSMSSSAPLIGSGGVLTMPRSDGFNDGFNIVQGVRIYDSTLGGWATPDAYQGEVHDPMSQKGYVWNRNNPVSYSDPSGYSNLFFDASVGDSGPTGVMYNQVAIDDGMRDIASITGASDPSSMTLAWPIAGGGALTSGFATKGRPDHPGIDIAAPEGTPVHAANGGILTEIPNAPGGGGNVAVVRNGTFATAYEHLAGFARGLRTGSHVEQGQVIGYVGNTGHSFGAHLHFEVMVNFVRQNPGLYHYLGRHPSLPVTPRTCSACMATFGWAEDVK